MYVYQYIISLYVCMYHPIIMFIQVCAEACLYCMCLCTKLYVSDCMYVCVSNFVSMYIQLEKMDEMERSLRGFKILLHS